MSDLEFKILELLNESNMPVSAAHISDALVYNKASVYRCLKKLLSENKIVQIGDRSRTAYGIHRTINKYSGLGQYSGLGEKVTDFKKITLPIELINFLSNAEKLDNDGMICQYTSIQAVISIIKNRSWYLGSPQNMNDGLELQNGLAGRTDIFFSSFMAEQKESIAMWSMYAQPWRSGVMISIPTRQFKKWVKEIETIYSANPVTKLPDRDKYVKLNNARVSITRVAYSNLDSDGSLIQLSCGMATNKCFNSINDSRLVGYIKDDAWSYEKEVRLRVDLGEGVDYDGVAVDVTDELISSMIITKGPRFEGDIIERFQKEYEHLIKTESSLFYGKLNTTPCDKCKVKNE